MLAAMLNKCVYEIEEMPTSEFYKWVQYMAEMNQEREADAGNILAMDPDAVIGQFTGG